MQQQAEQGLARIENGKALTPADLQQELTSILEQLETHEQRKGSYDPGTGEIAARDLPVYAIAKDQIVRSFTSNGRALDMELSVKLPNDLMINLGSGSVNLDANGMPIDAPSFSFDASHHENQVDYRVKIYEQVERRQDSPAPVGKGDLTSLTRYAIDAFGKEYQHRFGRPMTEIGGSLAWENKANFQRALIDVMTGKPSKVMPDRDPTQAELVEAVKQTSYGDHRLQAGFTEFKVSILERALWRKTNLGEGYSEMAMPDHIEVAVRKK